jgi:hypothetical protein
MGKLAGQVYRGALKGGDFLASNKMLAIGSMAAGAGLYAMDARDGYVGLGGSLGLLAAGGVGARMGYNYGANLSQRAVRRRGWMGSFNRGASAYSGWIDEMGQTGKSWMGRGAFARGFRSA